MSEKSKLRALVELASDPRTPEHERVAAALALAKRLKKEGIDDLYEERAPREDYYVTVQTMLVIVTESKDHYRVARLLPPKQFSDELYMIPKSYVREVVLMSPDEHKAVRWKGGRIIKAVTIDRRYFEHAATHGWDRWM